MGWGVGRCLHLQVENHAHRLRKENPVGGLGGGGGHNDGEWVHMRLGQIEE